MVTKITCTRRLTFEAGHRVMGHESKCRNLHGHSYKVEIRAEMLPVPGAGDQTDSIGRVIDFSVLKHRVGSWIDRYWDHAFICCAEDAEVIAALGTVKGQDEQPSRMFLLPMNPTAENLAFYLLHKVCPEELTHTGVVVTHVRVWETENCYADACIPGSTYS